MQYKIGKIAKIMGVTPEAIRHYERLGLIVPLKDPETNYRYYTREQIDQLLYIQRFSHMGMSLSDIRENILRGNIHTHREILQKKRSDYIQEMQQLQQKLLNMDHYIWLLKMTAYCLYHCTYSTVCGLYFISEEDCQHIQEDTKDSLQFQIFQKHADMFFQCTLLYVDEAGVRKDIKGFCIYEDCAVAIGINITLGFLRILDGDIVMYACEYCEAYSTMMKKHMQSFFQREHLHLKGLVLHQFVYRSFHDYEDTKRMEMFMIPFVRTAGQKD